MNAQLPISFDSRQPLAVRFAEWALTTDGQEVIRMSERIALDQAANGAKRISISWIWESIRRARKKSADNSLRAPLARRLRELHPELRDLIKIKGKKAA